MKPFAVLLFISNLAFSQIEIINVVDASAMNTCDGSATITANGTAGPFTFLWSNGSTNATVSGLCPGGYSVTVTNAYECQTVLYVTINITCDPDYSFTVYGNVTNACGATATGTITGVGAISDSPLNLQYSFLWDNGSTLPNRYNLQTGYHCVTVTSSLNGIQKCQGD